MRGRKNPATCQTAPNLPPCKICGEQGTGFHYGVTACGACKGFFRRSLVRKEAYLCIGSGNCIIGPETKRRKSCPKCRHDKCLAVGMSKEAIKTGRYSYVKKSHDIIEMIEHHFQHYVKRKQFGECKMMMSQEDNIIPDYEFPRKKIRTSCALEKVTDVFRQPGGEFMELSPTKPAESCRNIFQFENLENSSNLGINHFGDVVVSEAVRCLSMSEDISGNNDEVSPNINEQYRFDGAQDNFQNPCLDVRNSELLYYFDSQQNQHPLESTPTHSPPSLASPLSEASHSKESAASISPPWLEFPIYSDNSYSKTSSERQTSCYPYPNQDYDEDIELYGHQQRSENKEGFDGHQASYITLSATSLDYSKYHEIAQPFSPSSLRTLGTSEISSNYHEYKSYSQQNSHSQTNKLPVLHTPISNELEQLRRLSWDDINFHEDSITPNYDYFIENSNMSSNKTPLDTNLNRTCFHDNSYSFSPSEQESKELLSHDLSISSYWDMDTTTLRFQDGNSKVDGAENKDQLNFHECINVNKSCIYSDPLSICANYYRERLGSESSLTNSPGNDSIMYSPTTISTQYSGYADKCDSSYLHSTDVIERATKEEQHSGCTERLTVLHTVNLDSSTSFAAFHSKNDVGETLNIEPSTMMHSPTMSSEKSNEPLNFLNVSLLPGPQDGVPTVQKQKSDFSTASFRCLMESNEYSPKSDELFSNMLGLKTESIHDDELLERWTPFSLGDEAPRSIESEKECEKSARLQENDDDYKNKPLPWCEYTEAELDEVVMSLKSSYQKHVVLDTNLLSDQEIADKLQLFLDILQLREQTFGKFAPIDREDYFKILEATGIDLGGRREWVKTSAKIFNRTLQKTVRFFRSVPGFKDVCHEDKTILAKSCMYEYIILSCYRGVNVEKQVILDAEHKLAFSMDFFRLVFPEMEEHVLDIFEVSRKLMDLKLTFEETLILKAISILSPDRDKLKEFDKVDRMYWRLHCCLLLSLWRRVTSPWRLYARVISVVTDLRQLAFNGRQLMCNFRPDMLKLTKDIQVPLYLELMFTQADSIPESELK